MTAPHFQVVVTQLNLESRIWLAEEKHHGNIYVPCRVPEKPSPGDDVLRDKPAMLLPCVLTSHHRVHENDEPLIVCFHPKRCGSEGRLSGSVMHGVAVDYGVDQPLAIGNTASTMANSSPFFLRGCRRRFKTEATPSRGANRKSSISSAPATWSPSSKGFTDQQE